MIDFRKTKNTGPNQTYCKVILRKKFITDFLQETTATEYKVPFCSKILQE